MPITSKKYSILETVNLRLDYIRWLISIFPVIIDIWVSTILKHPHVSYCWSYILLYPIYIHIMVDFIPRHTSYPHYCMINIGS
jgi:hypothetical protein